MTQILTDFVVVDVSHHQPPDSLDWDMAMATGRLGGAIVKYSQGSAFADPAAMLHAWKAYSAKVPLLGGYHFGDGSDARRQAEWFLTCVRADYGSALEDVMLMLDLEQNAKSQMTVAGAETWLGVVSDAVGRAPWLYMGRDGPTGNRAGLPSQALSQYPLMLPAYGKHSEFSHAVPPGFVEPKGDMARAGTLRLWQFTDGAINGGPFPGLGKVDQSYFIGIKSLDEARNIWA